MRNFFKTCLGAFCGLVVVGEGWFFFAAWVGPAPASDTDFFGTIVVMLLTVLVILAGYILAALNRIAKGVEP
jgi:hypothetical protein